MIKDIRTYLRNNKNDEIKVTSFVNLLKFYFSWVRLKKGNRTALVDRQPWITFGAREYLKNIIHSKMKVFEFGSGGSTLYFLDNVSELVSVEHDKAWFNLVQSQLKNVKLSTFTGLLALPILIEEPIENPNYGDPEMYLSSDIGFLNKYSFIDYVSCIDKYPNEYFDIVSVDGRARPSCIKHSLSKIKTNGYLMLDNSDRKYYIEYLKNELNAFEKVFETFGPGPYNSSFWSTTFYKKK